MKRILSIETVRQLDDCPDGSYLEQGGFEERLEQYRDNQFYFIGIRAKAEVQFEDNGAIQTLQSGGLWGIESDSDEDYLKSVEQEEIDQLIDTLKAAGFAQEMIDEALIA